MRRRSRPQINQHFLVVVRAPSGRAPGLPRPGAAATTSLNEEASWPFGWPPRASEPVRIVVELRQDEFQTLNAAIGPWVASADYLRILALRVIAEAECDREP